MGKTKLFSFWYLQNRKWHKSCSWVDPTRRVESMIRDWLDMRGVQLHPLLYPYSFVYDGIILEHYATLIGCGYGDWVFDENIVVVRDISKVEKCDDIATMEKDKIELHCNNLLIKNAKLVPDVEIDFPASVYPSEIKPHKDQKAKQICQMQIQKIRQDLSSLVSEVDKIIEEAGEEFKVDVEKLNVPQVNHAEELLDNLYCQVQNNVSINGITIKTIFERIETFLESYCKELQGKSVRPSCGGSYHWVKFYKPLPKFYVGPARAGTSTLPIQLLNFRFSTYATVGDLVNLYNYTPETSEILCIDDLDRLEYNNQTFTLDTPVQEIIEMERFDKFYFSITGFYEEGCDHEEDHCIICNKPEVTSDDRDVDVLLEFIEGDQNGEKKKRRQRKKKKTKYYDVQPAHNKNEETCPEKSKDEKIRRIFNLCETELKINKEICTVQNDATLNKEAENSTESKRIEIDKQITKTEDDLKQHKNVVKEFINKKGADMKTLLSKCSDVEERIHERNKKITKNEEQIRFLQKENKELSEKSTTDQKDAEKLERKKHKLEKYIDKEMDKMKQNQLELEREVKTLQVKLLKTKLDSKKQLNEPQIPISKEDKMLTFLDRAIATKERELECPLCLEISETPIFMCPESHIVCAHCKPKVKKCPECRTPYPDPAKRHRYAEKTAEELLDLKNQRKEIERRKKIVEKNGV